jgi:hypothetical protein
MPPISTHLNLVIFIYLRVLAVPGFASQVYPFERRTAKAKRGVSPRKFNSRSVVTREWRAKATSTLFGWLSQQWTLWLTQQSVFGSQLCVFYLTEEES